MIGISFAYPDAADKFRHPPWLELQVCRIEGGGEPITLTNGKTLPGWVWRKWNIPLKEREQLMDAVVKELVESHAVDGFTLWWNPTKKQWQMNVRRKEGPWSVSFITQAEAEAIFSTLQAKHPDGPWEVIAEYVQDDKAARRDFNTAAMTPAERAEQVTADLFDSKPERTNRAKQPDLLDALERAGSLFEKGQGILARVMRV